MKAERIAKICSGQDGAIWGRYLFRFSNHGFCNVYNLTQLQRNSAAEAVPVAQFWLDRADQLMPHSNAVSFGVEYYEPGDEFPLLYTNIYNSYAKQEDPMAGVCCAYRLLREGSGFTTELVQIITIGFTDDQTLWRSGAPGTDVRPYGNFVIDRERQRYCAFTMRDGDATTRYFTFSLPSCRTGVPDKAWDVRRVTLMPEDILDVFDCEYHRYLQGACVKDGLIYFLEGFTDDRENPPALRVISLQQRRQLRYCLLRQLGLTIEPELIDFAGEHCYYGDHSGNLYTLQF